MFRLRHSAAALVAAGGVGLTGGIVALAGTGTLGHSTDASLVLSTSPSTKGFHMAQKADATEPTETAEPDETHEAAPAATHEQSDKRDDPGGDHGGGDH